jgi:hypothetical protein
VSEFRFLVLWILYTNQNNTTGEWNFMQCCFIVPRKFVRHYTWSQKTHFTKILSNCALHFWQSTM